MLHRAWRREVGSTKKAYAIIVIVLAVIISTFPRPHMRTRIESYVEYETEARSDLKRILDCSSTHTGGFQMGWGLKNMPDTLRIVVTLESTEEICVYIRSLSRVVTDRAGKTHHYTVLSRGPSLTVEIENSYPTV